MQQFNVLDRHLQIHQHHLLEASAGTGKTFSIQNIVVRLLIESNSLDEDPLALNKILVMTFTRAATRDLKQRIRANIESSINDLNNWIQTGSNDESMADYLVHCTEKGMEVVVKAKKRLQYALFNFDQAQIFTIHGFCARMLRDHAFESNTGLHSVKEDETIPQKELRRVIYDFFRTEMRVPNYSPGQLKIILNEDPDHKQLMRVLSTSHDIETYPSFSELFHLFKSFLTSLKKDFEIDSDKVIEDFQKQANGYKNYKSGETKAETLAKIKRFALLFDKLDWGTEDFDGLLEDDLVWTQALDPSLIKGKGVPAEKELHFPILTDLLKKQLAPVVKQARAFPYLLARLAKDCKALLRRYQIEEEKFFPDDFLQKMNGSLSDTSFLNAVKSRYQAAVIDEFQDTDPLQWAIFRRLFLPDNGEWKGHLYLVGDPKQSIYSFRQADIYTYLEAAKAIGEDHRFSLDTNYRSQYFLVQALNSLFSTQRIPQLIPLPKQSISLAYRPVKSSHQNQHSPFNDSLGALHFFIGDALPYKRSPLSHLENEIFFPFIANEILKLTTEQQMNWGQCAVLVKDRFQALRLTEYFTKRKIPYVNQRGTSLAESPALFSLIDLIKAVLSPRDQAAVKVAVGSSLIGWNHDHLLTSPSFEQVMTVIHKLRKTIFESGFAHFFREFLQSSWKLDGLSVKESLLAQDGGVELYQDLQQIADVVIDCQDREWSSPEGLIAFLDGFQLWQQYDDERVKRSHNPAQSGVKILTLHFSKGLEFDVVFGLGLVSHTPIHESLIPVDRNDNRLLSVLFDGDEKRREYFEEIDAEKMRQFYVAMTRAKLRLYVPVVQNLPVEGLECGEASPMELFIERFSDNGKSFFDFLFESGQDHHITHSIETGSNHYSHKVRESDEFTSPLEWTQKFIEIPFREQTISSFTNLSTHTYSADDSPTILPHDFNTVEKNIHTLPSGRETGILIHTILEKLSFSSLDALSSIQQAVSLVRPFIEKSPFRDWEQVITHMIFQAIKTPFACNKLNVSLSQISESQLYKEMPFIFSSEEDSRIENVEIKEGYIKGVIDLVFMSEGIYYILDWKTNWLGPHDSDYSRENLKSAMEAENYFLQAALYKEALKRYIDVVDDRPFDQCFGGIIYIFIRGVQNEETHGMYRV